jgi:hypothetical protein
VITAVAAQKTFPITSVDIKVGGTTVTTIAAPGPYTYTYTVPSTQTTSQSVSATITDAGFYTNSGTAVGTIPVYKP